ncbi:hypothetical protein PHLCEN_2v3640 [Hermanssonia centrifuga]|uniref:YTH domain-containing protein n=1 Tax=Hermanssonia centrifuga TaxID=98765 RepID=A0A2R6QEL0_9APHY|nr:hypothetical protein PHLCEN_2v3640 [Hermanssonia centrifuga]
METAAQSANVEGLARGTSSDKPSFSAPPEMYNPHRPLSKSSASVPQHGERSYDAGGIVPVAAALISQKQPDSFELDPQAPLRAIKQHSAGDILADSDGIRRWDAVSGDILDPVEEEEEQVHPTAERSSSKSKGKARDTSTKEDEGPVWGESFRVEWVRAERLPFYRTRHLRNPWNHDREVKVSRDGTELEPSVGQALLDEWDKPDSQQSQSARLGTKSTPMSAAAGSQIQGES